MKALVAPKWRWWIVVVLCAWLLIGVARDVRSASLFGDIDVLEGTFVQELRNEEGELIGSSTGDFSLLRPHFFRWSIESPGQQLLLGDGEFFWQYDKDLATVIRRPLDEQLQSPLGVLLADEQALTAHYDVVRSNGEIRLRPLADNPLFKSVTVFTEKGLPATLHLIDNLNQSITLHLEVQEGRRPTPVDFSFEPPPGADLTIVNP